MISKPNAPRLTHAPNRIGDTHLPNRLDRAGTATMIRTRSQPWRQWYGTQEWKKLKQAAHLRDRWICQRTGELCIGKHPEPNSPVANHRTPHRGNRALFFDLNNIETVAKHVHDSEIEREEIAAGREPAGCWD